ncbi:hypothetical protein OHU34_43290 [Streptomyces sp. NBC_00080]|uniref:hypothetical protein n=1 Tax=Streptomyces sp. NBC_00080 TaxID=2975645 RepID=UPI00324D43BB
MTSVSVPVADAGSIRQTRAGMLALAERRLRHLLAQQQTDQCATGPRPARGADGTRLGPVFCVSGFLAAGGNPGDPVAIDTCAALALLYLPDRIPGEPARAHADRLAARLPAAARTLWNDLRAEPATGRHPHAPAAAEGAPGSAPSPRPAAHESGRRTIHRPLLLGALLAGRPDLSAPFDSYGPALEEALQLRDDLLAGFGPATEDTDGPAAPRHSPAGAKATAERRIAGLVDRACAALATPALGRPWRQEFTRLATELAYRSR